MGVPLLIIARIGFPFTFRSTYIRPLFFAWHRLELLNLILRDIWRSLFLYGRATRSSDSVILLLVEHPHLKLSNYHVDFIFYGSFCLRFFL